MDTLNAFLGFTMLTLGMSCLVLRKLDEMRGYFEVATH